MTERAHGRGERRAAVSQEERGRDAGLTFRAVGIPALAGALASAPRKPADARAARRPCEATLPHDADDAVALRSGN
ncbi:hypothetical protein ACERNI_06815 [Camelimonas sp. ID_303_24]